MAPHVTFAASADIIPARPAAPAGGGRQDDEPAAPGSSTGGQDPPNHGSNGGSEEEEGEDDAMQDDGDADGNGDGRQDDDAEPERMDIDGGSPPKEDNAREDPSLKAGAERLLSLDRVHSLQTEDVLPAGPEIPRGGQVETPALYSIPPRHSLGDATRLVGIPATQEHLDAQVYTQNGYGGLEALSQMEGLRMSDLAQLYNFFGPDDDVLDLVLAPRKTPLPKDELDPLLRSIGLQREVACLLTEFEPDRLAHRVFGTVTLLRKLIRQHQQMASQVDNSSQAVQDALDTKEEVSRLKRDYKFQSDYWEKKMAETLKQKDRVNRQHREDIQKLISEHDTDMASLRKQVKTLTQQLDDSKTHCRILDQRLRQSRFEVADAMNFLGENAQLCFNWPRLRDLLFHFQDGTPVPSTWQTVISVSAQHDITAQPGPFVRMQRPDDDEEHKDSEQPPPEPQVDLTEDTPSETPRPNTSQREQSSSGRKRSSKRKSHQVPDMVQEFPANWDETSDLSCRPEGEALMLSEEQARDLLKDYPVVWSQLRLDVQVLMRTGFKYPGAIEWLGQDRPVHSRFHRADLVEMLIQMMFWNKLDSTPWASYVPRRYFVSARSELDNRLENEIEPPYWGPLEPGTDDVELLEPESPERDDKSKDDDWVEGQEPDDGIDDESEPLEDSPAKSTRSASKRNRKNSTSKKASKSRKQSDSENEKVPTEMARKKYSKLTYLELTIIEIPGPDNNSWRHYGIRVKPADPSSHAATQTIGFVCYVPNRHDMEILKKRFKPSDYKDLMALMPWREMFDKRPRTLFFHRRKDLTQIDKDGLDEWMDLVSENTRAFWEFLHWITFLLDASVPAWVQRAHTKRANRRQTVGNKLNTRKAELIASGMQASLFDEPGVWTYPKKLCPWILMDKDHINPDTNKPYTLKEQLDLVDRQEPCRMEWSYCATDEERIAHLPADLRARIIPPEERDLITDILS